MNFHNENITNCMHNAQQLRMYNNNNNTFILTPLLTESQRRKYIYILCLY